MKTFIALVSAILIVACGNVTANQDASVLSDSTASADAPPGGVAITPITAVNAHIYGSATVQVALRGKPNEAVTYAITAAAGGGSFSASTGGITLGGDGTGTLSATYSAPSVNGSFAHSISVTSSVNVVTTSAFSSVVSASEITVGHATQFATTTTYTLNYLLATKVTLPTLSTLARIGVIGQSAGSNVKMGVYSDSAGTPGALLASFGPQALPNARLEVPVTNVTLQPGAYWIAAVYDVTATIGHAAAPETVAYTARSFASALPTAFPAATTDADNGGPNYYIVVLQ